LKTKPLSQSLDTPELIHFNTENLRLALIEAQFRLRAEKHDNSGHGVLVLVSGIEMAGKGEAITQLREWMDPRYLMVKAGVPTLLQPNQPFWQRYVPHLPAKGQLMVLFGNWYSDLLAAVMQGQNMSKQQFDQSVLQMREFENDLIANGISIIKCWFDIPWECLQQRLDSLDPSEAHWQQLHGLDWRNKAQYDTVQAWRQRFSHDWFVIDGEDADQRDLTFGHLMLDALKTPREAEGVPHPEWKNAEIPAILLHPDQAALEKESYKASLKKLQKKVARQLREQVKKAPVIIMFEGMDAAGKGGAIRRIVAKLDPREYEIHSIAAPEPYELRRPYLWRFWMRLPQPESLSIFDRSWYGRVLVERLEGFASDVEWQRAYDEINRFEAQLVQRGFVVIKLWLAISPEEQLLRFNAREETPHKQFKITEDDWRNRDKWDSYLQAAADMLDRTNTDIAPWHVVATDDKYSARIQVLEAVLKQLQFAAIVS
jgi:polyphosphate:AMP phosphotransferase